MTPKSRSTRTGRMFIGMMKSAIEMPNSHDQASLCHRLPVALPDGSPPITYTVDLAPDVRGTFLLTCRELPEVATFGETEEDALSMAELAIEEALATRRRSSNLPT